MRFALERLRPLHAPEPLAAHQRRPSAGAATRPRTAVVDKCDQRGPHRDASDEAVGAVDRVDDPTPRAATGGLELLALDRIARAGSFELVAYHLLGLAVGVADQCEIGFGLDEEVLGSEARHRDPLRSIG